MSVVPLAVLPMILLVVTVGMATFLLVTTFSITMDSGLRLPAFFRFGRAAFCDILANGCAGRTAHTRTHHGTSLATHGLPDCGSGTATDRPTDDCTGLAVTLGRHRRPGTATDCPADHGTGLAADRLTDRRTGCGSHTTTDGGFRIAVGSHDRG